MLKAAGPGFAKRSTQDVPALARDRAELTVQEVGR